MNTHTVRERTYRNPDGQLITDPGKVVGGAILVASPGDEMDSSEARALGLLGDAPATGEASVPGLADREATAAADIARAVAARAEADASGEYTTAMQADAERRAASALAQAKVSIARAEALAESRQDALDEQRATFDASWAAREAEHENVVAGLRAELAAAQKSAGGKANKQRVKPADKQADAPADKDAAAAGDTSTADPGLDPKLD